MSKPVSKRVEIEPINGTTVYSAGFWPGRQEVLTLTIFFLTVLGIFIFILWILHGLQQELAKADFASDWLEVVLLHLVLGAFDLTLIGGLGFLTLWMPYFLIYELSPKRFWIQNDTLFHTAYLLGALPHKRTIPFAQILDVDVHSSNGGYAIGVRYERSLPRWLFVMLVFWNEKLTQWPLTLMNGIPTQQEAESLQAALLEPMTDSETCRITSDNLK